MSKRCDASLKLTLPKALEAQVIDHLLKHPEWVGPFITHRVEGHGNPDGIASVAEQVRGRAERVQIEILLDASHARDLIDHLRENLPSPDIVWWLSAVTESGSFA
jgi:hypothetical protein